MTFRQFSNFMLLPLGLVLGLLIQATPTSQPEPLSPVDATQNAQIATLNAWAFGATQEMATLPFTRTPTFAPGTNTHTPTRTSTPISATATHVPTSASVTATVVPLATATSTELPPMVYAGNVSGSSLWVRECAGLKCEILARVLPGEWVAVNRLMTKIDGNHEWIAMWNQGDGVIGGWVAMRQISPPVRLLAFRPQ